MVVVKFMLEFELLSIVYLLKYLGFFCLVWNLAVCMKLNLTYKQYYFTIH